MILATTLGSAIFGSVLSAFLQVLFDRLASRQFLYFFKKWKFDEESLRNLTTALLAVNAVLGDAEEKQISNFFVKQWVDELKDIVYQAEDVLDEINTFVLRYNLEDEFQGNINKNHGLDKVSKDLESELLKITKRLTFIASQINVLDLKGGIGVKPSQRLPTTSLVDESEVYGRDKDRERIVDFLLSSNVANEKEIPRIAIVGIGGVGKTTLAQLVYNDLRVKNHFDPRLWVYISEELNVLKVTKSIFESVTRRDCNITDLNTLQIELEARLARKRFILVLDDAWNENYVDWDVLCKPLKAGASGSRIIVTTRNSSVASAMGAFYAHPLLPLLDEDCWSVFASHAFRRESVATKSNLEVIGEKIVKKCNGLPLAAKTLGGLLQSKVEAREWEKILNSNIWDLPNDRSQILPILLLSYHHLPPHLKQCFAYCSIFPKGCSFHKEEIILLWMAEGFVQEPDSEKRMEEVGDEYFHELLSRSFFQQSGSFFKMHDLVNDLAQFVSGEFCFNFKDGKRQRRISEKARHFAYTRELSDGPEKFEALDEAKYLRTFLPVTLSISSQSCSLNTEILDGLLPNLRCLRVLSLCRYWNCVSMPDDYFSKMKHIRYLDLSNTGIEKLPKSVCSLFNLQTLLLSNSPLRALPSNMWHLVNLRYLDVSGTKLKGMPPEFGRLKCLQTLTTFVVADGRGAKLGELGGLSQLHGKLVISELQNVHQVADAAAADLKNKKYLKELIFKWNTVNRDGLQIEADVLDKLRPHEQIEKLTIENFVGKKLPAWLGDASFSQMVSIRLRECSRCSSLPLLGQLPSLQELYIEDCPNLIEKLPIHLPSLKTLHIDKCRKLDFLKNINQHQYPALQCLHISRSCDNLFFFPLGLFATLEELLITDCRFLKFLELAEMPHQGLTSLQKLAISDCRNLERFPARWLPTPKLTSFSLSNCQRLESMPDQLCTILASLTERTISHCPRLHSPILNGVTINN